MVRPPPSPRGNVSLPEFDPFGPITFEESRKAAQLNHLYPSFKSVTG